MPSQFFYYSVSGTGSRASLDGDNQGAYVMSGVGVSSTDGVAIYGGSSTHTIVVEGTLVGFSQAIKLETGLPGRSDHYVKIGAEATVMSYSAEAIIVEGYRSQVINDGFVRGDTYGIIMVGRNTETTSTLTNSGWIEARRSAAVFHSGYEDLSLINTGTIKGSTLSFDSNGDGATTITNNGIMSGDIMLTGGDDVYSGRNGTVVGKVFGEAGADTSTLR